MLLWVATRFGYRVVGRCQILGRHLFSQSGNSLKTLEGHNYCQLQILGGACPCATSVPPALGYYRAVQTGGGTRTCAPIQYFGQLVALPLQNLQQILSLTKRVSHQNFIPSYGPALVLASCTLFFIKLRFGSMQPTRYYFDWSAVERNRPTGSSPPASYQRGYGVPTQTTVEPSVSQCDYSCGISWCIR